MLAHILGGGSNSRLYRALVVDKQHRGQRRRLVRRQRARYDANSASTARRARRHAAAARSGDRRRDRADHRDKGVTRGRTRAHQDAADRRRRLCAGQPGRAWRAGTAPRSPPARPSTTCGAGPTASAPSPPSRCGMRRAQWLDKRRSVTGYLIKDSAARRRRRDHDAGVFARVVRASRCFARSAHAASAMTIETIVSPSRHQGLAGARAVGAADRARITPSTAAPSQDPSRQARRRQFRRRPARRGRRRTRRQDLP